MERNLNNYQPATGHDDIRGFEWYFLLRLATLGRPTTFLDTRQPPRRFSFSADGKRLAAAHTRGGNVTVWDVDTGTQLLELGQRDDTKWLEVPVAISPDGEWLAYAPIDHSELRVRNLSTNVDSPKPSTHDAVFTAVAFSPDNRSIVTGMSDGTVQVLDTVTLDTKWTRKQHSRPVWAMSFARDGSMVACGSEDCEVSLWDAHSGDRYTHCR